MNSTEQQQPSQTSQLASKLEETIVPSKHDRQSPAMPSSSCRPLKKRRLADDYQASVQLGDHKSILSIATNDKTGHRHGVTWNDDLNEVHFQEDPSKAFPDEYKESDVWYSRQDYETFMMDRIDTVERLREERTRRQSLGHVAGETSPMTNCCRRLW